MCQYSSRADVCKHSCYWIWPNFGFFARIWAVCNSSCVRKRQSVTSTRNEGAGVDVLFRRSLRVKDPCHAIAVEIIDGHQHNRADLRGRADYDLMERSSQSNE